ncbi:hypothetical protein [Streptomyces sp. H27-C3]|uniref:hypothetical protein n=1 Tax=Streptomyces sp. H27-C3 TaxID=3046305 RepID=UPI0024BBA9D5|nr:hypothetical protein [Streptomyces sp. H27-C3]MDJ0460606.1 hypothetical protein [Streptomyces sp. H27-C3]
MTRRQRAAHRVWHGSAELARRIGDRAAAWVAKGPTRSHRIVRGLLLLGGLYFAARIIRAAPGVLWLLVPAWCVAAVRHAPPVEDEEQPPVEAGKTAATDSRDAVLALLFECLGDRPAVHLSTVLKHLQKRGHGRGWTVSDLRVRLEALGIPVQPKVKVGGVPTRGVRRDDLTPPSPHGGPVASPAPSTAA